MLFRIQSTGTRQIIGALAGVLIATGGYMMMTYATDQRALLISAPQFANQTGRVSVNDANIDPASLERIVAKARQVAVQVQDSQAERNLVNAAEDPSIKQRLERRAKVDTYAALASPGGTVYMTKEQAQDILAKRSQSIVMDGAQDDNAPSADAISRESPTVEMHAGAPLSQTGIATNIIVLLALGAASAWRFAPLLSRRFSQYRTS